jgi:ABC-2 type transport system permease protein
VRALSIAWKDLRHTYHSPAGVVMMLVAPLLLAFVLGAAFGSGSSFSISATKIAVVDLDKGTGAATGTPTAGATITAILTSPSLADLLAVTQTDTAENARALVDSGDAAAAVIIPAGLTSALVSTGAGPAAKVQIYKDPTLTIGPAIITAVVQSATQSLNGARAAAATSAQLAASAGVTDPQALSALASAAAQAYAAKSQTETLVSLAARAPEIPGVANQMRPNVASQVLVGMMLFFMLFGAATPARSILDEHREGTLPRLFTTPTPRSAILGGKYLAVFLVVLVQSVVLVVAGRLLLGAHWGDPGPVLVLILTGSLVAASLGLITVSFAKTPAQAGAVGSAIFVFLGLISGNFTGSANIGGAYAIVQRFSPLGWLMRAWKDLLYGGSWGSIAVPVVVVLGFALVFFAIATFFFRKRYA